jgi:sulfur carrier protein ThiS
MLELPENATAQDVLDHFDLQRIVSIAINDEIEIRPDHRLADGDCVELFRVAGGG